MRFFLRFFGIFALAAGLAVLAHYNVGNVVIFSPPYRIDFSLNFFLLVFLFLVFALYFIMRAVDAARRLPSQAAQYRLRKRENEGNHALREAVRMLFEGRFAQAEKSAARAQAWPENAGSAALIGARAAHALSRPDRRDVFLAPLEDDAVFRTACLMTRLELLARDHQTREALAVLEELNAAGARHVQAQRWALEANRQAGNWETVLHLVQSLEKHHAIRPVLASRLRELAYDSLFSASAHDAGSVRRLWENMPEADRLLPFAAARAAAAFAACGLGEEAGGLLAQALEAGFDERLVRACRHASAETGSPALLKQIERCEGWLAQHPSDAGLALTLGALCFKDQLWGKAQNYLERAARCQDDPAVVREAHLFLGRLYEALGNTGEAARHYRACALAGEDAA
ncbi:MAG: heme biosynthesis protein HemY [Oxalobacter formigenes]|nr:heme biosynthesis protein HemY [Oxalobacter formigenes]